MKNFRTYQLAIQFYRECQRYKFKGALQNQFERATLSIVLNLAEGTAKPTRNDRRKFYFTALGSLRETQAILELTQERNLAELADRLGASLYCLCLRC